MHDICTTLNTQNSTQSANQAGKSAHQCYKALMFNPFLSCVSVVFTHHHARRFCGCGQKNNKKDKKVATKALIKKHLLQLGALSLLALPAKSLLASSAQDVPSKLDEIVANNEMVVATVNDDETVFVDGELVHGLGYDVAKRYAEHLGVSLVLKTYENKDSLMKALAEGEADMALGVSADDGTKFHTELIACDDKTQALLTQRGLDAQVGFTFLSQDGALIDHSASFLCSQEQLGQTQTLAQFYDRNLLKNDYSEHHFKQALTKKLPLYETAFKAEADKYDHDWQLLAAISYQESHLNPEAVSPTGVQGLMMLTQETAKEMGVDDRTDAIQSIQGGAKYLQNVYEMFADVPQADRLWFVLASYNMGPNAIKRIQKELQETGKNPHSWSDVYVYLSDNAHTNSRYVQCMHYVTNIRTYLEEIKSTMQA